MVRFLITIGLLLATAAGNLVLSHPEADTPRRPLKEFPQVIDNWKMVGEQTIEGNSMAVLQVDDYLMRTYVNSKGESIGLYIGYFRSQSQGTKGVHSPRQCLPGAGWSILETKEILISFDDSHPQKFPVNFYLMGKGKDRDLYIWWYQGRGRIYANEYLNKIYQVWDSIMKGRTDGALVRVHMAVPGSADATLTTQLRFIALFSRDLTSYIPN